MRNTSIDERDAIASAHINPWPRAAFASLHSNLTVANLVGLVGGCLALFLLLVLHEPWDISIPLYLTMLVWTILHPRVALYLMAFAVPWGSLDYIDIKGLRLNSADLLVAFLAVGWLLSFSLRRTNLAKDGYPHHASPLDRESSTIPGYLTLATLALITTMLLSMTVATDIAASLKEISKWLEFLVLLLLGAPYLRTRRQLWTIILLVCLAGITQAVFGYFQAFFNLGPVAFVRDTSLRIYGTFGQPNPYAGYINIPLSIAAALMLLGSNWKTRILAGLTVILLAVAEYLTQSRGGEIAIAAALLFIVAVGTPRLSLTVRLFVLAGLGAVEAFLAGLIPVYLFNPVLRALGLIDLVLAAPTKQNFSTAERLAHWIAGLRMFFAHPILGVGIGNYADAYPHYFVTIFMDPLGHAHNYYINIAAETGSIGLIAYLLFLLATFVAGGQAYRTIGTMARGLAIWRGPLTSKFVTLLHALNVSQYGPHQASRKIAQMLSNDRALAIGLLAALISVCVHNIFDNLYIHSLTNLIALLLIVLIRLEGVASSKVGVNGGKY
jgi:O-antigen ligase